MIAAVSTIPWWHKLSFNWFDVALVLVLAFGFWRGRKRGMSREALPTLFWILSVAIAGFGNAPLGDLLQKTGVIRKIFGITFNERTVCYVTSYLFIFLVIWSIYSVLAKRFREKLSGSNTFGGGEYYLGMISGMIRYACITIFFLALLSAPFYSQAEIAAREAYNNRWFGGGLQGYNGNFIPSVSEVQTDVFKSSMIGPAIKDNLSMLLIASAAPVIKTAHH